MIKSLTAEQCHELMLKAREKRLQRARKQTAISGSIGRNTEPVEKYKYRESHKWGSHVQ